MTLFGKNSFFDEGLRDKADEVLCIPHTSFKTDDPDIDLITYDRVKAILENGILVLRAPIQLPEGCTIIDWIIYGVVADPDAEHRIYRIPHNSEVEELIGSNRINLVATIAAPYPTHVENKRFRYIIELIDDLDTNDKIYGGYLTYTLRGKR